MATSGYASKAPLRGDDDDAVVEPSIEGLADLKASVESAPVWVPRPVVASTADALMRIRADGTSSLAITSARRGEGRTTIALAAAVAERYDYGRKTILLDLDLDRATIGERTGEPAPPGLAEYLRGAAELGDCIRWHDDHLGILSAGSVESGSEPLMAAFLRSWALDQIGLLADVVVADLPPLPPSGSGARLAAAFNTVLMVVRAGVTSADAVKTALRSLAEPPPMLLNGVQGSKGRTSSRRIRLGRRR